MHILMLKSTLDSVVINDWLEKSSDLFLCCSNPISRGNLTIFRSADYTFIYMTGKEREIYTKYVGIKVHP